MGDVKVKALVDTLSDTLAKVVAKTIADTVTGVVAEARVKTEVDSTAGMKAYTVVVTLNKLKLTHSSKRRLTGFHKCRPNLLPTH